MKNCKLFCLKNFVPKMRMCCWKKFSTILRSLLKELMKTLRQPNLILKKTLLFKVSFCIIRHNYINTEKLCNRCFLLFSFCFKRSTDHSTDYVLPSCSRVDFLRRKILQDGVVCCKNWHSWIFRRFLVLVCLRLWEMIKNEEKICFCSKGKNRTYSPPPHPGPA